MVGQNRSKRSRDGLFSQNQPHPPDRLVSLLQSVACSVKCAIHLQVEQCTPPIIVIPAINIIAINVVAIINHRQAPLSILPSEPLPVCSTLKTGLVFIINIYCLSTYLHLFNNCPQYHFIFIINSPPGAASSLLDLEDEACFRNFQSRADIHQNSLDHGNMCSIFSTIKI